MKAVEVICLDSSSSDEDPEVQVVDRPQSPPRPGALWRGVADSSSIYADAVRTALAMASALDDGQARAAISANARSHSHSRAKGKDASHVSAQRPRASMLGTSQRAKPSTASSPSRPGETRVNPGKTTVANSISRMSTTIGTKRQHENLARPKPAPVKDDEVIHLSSDTESLPENRSSDHDSDDSRLPAGLADSFAPRKRVRRFKRIRRADDGTSTSSQDNSPAAPRKLSKRPAVAGQARPWNARHSSTASSSLRNTDPEDSSSSALESDTSVTRASSPRSRDSKSPLARPGQSDGRLTCRKSVPSSAVLNPQRLQATSVESILSRRPAPRLIFDSMRRKEKQPHPQVNSPAMSLASTKSSSSPDSASPSCQGPSALTPKRSRRQVEPAFNVDRVALEDVQAQEAEFARLRAEKSLIDSIAVRGDARPKEKNKSPVRQRTTDTVAAVDLCSSSHYTDASVDTMDTKSVKSDFGRMSKSVSPVQPTRSPDVKVHSDSDALLEVSPTTTLSASRLRKPASSSVLPPLERVKWNEPVPVNLLDVEGTIPFADANDKSLHVYDRTGELREKCAFVATFGQAQQLASSFYLAETHVPPTSQEKTDQSVRQLLSENLIAIRRCAKRRSNSVVTKSRQRTQSYMASLTQQRLAVLARALNRTAATQNCALPIDLKPGVARDRVILMLGSGEHDRLREVRVDQLTHRHVLTAVRPLNRSVTCISVKRNVRVEDDPLLRFVPVPNDESQEQKQVAAHGAQQLPSGEFDLPPSALDDEVAEYALRLVVKGVGDGESVFKALSKIVGLEHAYSDYVALKKMHDAVHATKNRLADAKAMIDDTSGHGYATLMQSVVDLKRTGNKTMRERLTPPSTAFISHAVRAFAESKTRPVRSRDTRMNVRSTEDYGAMIESYRDLFCRICYTYDCQEHGIEQPQPARRVDPTYPELVTTLAVDSDDEDMLMSNGNGSDSDGSDQFEPSVCTSSSHQVRRSSRSATVASSIATSIWEAQEQRRPRPTSQKRVALQSVDPTEYVDFSHVELLTATVKRLLVTDAPCSSECVRSTATGDVHQVIDPSVNVTVQKLARLVGTSSCVIAAIMKPIPCASIDTLLLDYRHKLQQQQQWQDDSRGADGVRRSKKDSRGSGSRGSSNRELLKRTRIQRLVDRGANHAYEPCTHDGACESTACNCIRRDHMCGKACACPRDCTNRFRGCLCSAGGCRTSSCPCYAAGRECDPDMCVTCGASSVALVPFLKFADGRHPAHPLPGRTGSGDRVDEGTSSDLNHGLATCANVHLQLGLHHRIAIGDSGIHGWGGFAVDAIRRGAFVAEYPGEQISQDEADRRGQVYDRVSMSYLFDLNEDVVVDAIRKGNKSRFINHEPAQPNCEAKVVQVGADHRITIWAKRDIQAGEELTFDYGRKFTGALDLSQVRLTGTTT